VHHVLHSRHRPFICWFGPVEQSAKVVFFATENTRHLCLSCVLEIDDIALTHSQYFHEVLFDVFRIIVGRIDIGNAFPLFLVVGVGNIERKLPAITAARFAKAFACQLVSCPYTLDLGERSYDG